MYENLEAQDLRTFYISEFRNFQLQAPANSKIIWLLVQNPGIFESLINLHILSNI